ncbi:MAG: hypothetical protein GYA22_08875 [Bacteroidales bacterium]|nr:hypothetical protein [Bacteroidales bacterium]
MKNQLNHEHHASSPPESINNAAPAQRHITITRATTTINKTGIFLFSGSGAGPYMGGGGVGKGCDGTCPAYPWGADAAGGETVAGA